MRNEEGGRPQLNFVVAMIVERRLAVHAWPHPRSPGIHRNEKVVSTWRVVWTATMKVLRCLGSRLPAHRFPCCHDHFLVKQHSSFDNIGPWWSRGCRIVTRLEKCLQYLATVKHQTLPILINFPKALRCFMALSPERSKYVRQAAT